MAANPARRRKRNRNRQSRAYRAGAYRGDHQSTRAQALELLRDGVDRCPRCGQPMWSWQALDWGHATDLARGGDPSRRRLEHRACNRRAGARLSLAIQRGRSRVVKARTSQRW